MSSLSPVWDDLYFPEAGNWNEQIALDAAVLCTRLAAFRTSVCRPWRRRRVLDEPFRPPAVIAAGPVCWLPLRSHGSASDR